MEGDTTDMERTAIVHRYSKKGKHVRKRRLTAETETDVERPQKRNETESRGEGKPSPKQTPPVDNSESDSEEETNIYKGPIFSIKSRAEAIQRKLINHLTDPDNGIKQGPSKYILNKIANLQNLLQESLLINSKLEGKLEALKSESKKQRKEFAEVGKKATSAVQSEKLTYAERLGIKSKAAGLSNLRQNPPNVVLIRPKDTAKYTNSEETKRALIDLVSPKEDNLQVKNVRRIQGSAVIVETAKSSNVHSLIANEKLKTAGLVVDVPAKKSPRIIIYGAPRRENDMETLQAIIDQNFSEQEKKKYAQQTKIAFKTGNKNNKDSCNIVLETSKEAREILIKKERIYIMWQCCRVQDYIVATRCYKCHWYLQEPTMASKQKITVSQPGMITVGQLNGQNSKAVLDEIRCLLKDKHIDILAIQEPYSFNDKIPSLGNFKVLSDTKRFSSITSQNTIKAAIVIANQNYTVLKLEQLSNTHFICAEITAGRQKFYVISSYFQRSDNIEPYLQHLDAIITTLKGQNITICLDANAKSEIWHSRLSDERGEKLEILIAQRNLFILNTPSDTYTFDSFQGQTNIDVTLTTSSLYNSVTNWEIHDGATTSDHNLITFQIKSCKTGKSDLHTLPRYNLKRANWKRFEQVLEQERARTQTTTNLTNSNKAAIEITQILQAACNAAIPKKKQFPKSVPWWNSHLTELKTLTTKARRKYQQTSHEPRRSQEKMKYSSIRNKYVAAIRKAKLDSWKNFVTTEGNANPWGRAYKICTQKITTESLHESIKYNDTHALTWEESTTALLNALLPCDNASDEDSWHKAARIYTQKPPDTNNSAPFTPEEIQNVIRNLKNKKAPGHDLIDNETLKIAWNQIGDKITQLTR
ncbi:unnamed protein product [Xylocopa violacea]|uniref:Endonuclease/exonuclease/phosphatase domain-containing protein n=1 Tax=Xylocopa violacea TaxID=135666 RepID=A0ABP1MXX6_XYLVO